jgi:hypothetical protein
MADNRLLQFGPQNQDEPRVAFRASMLPIGNYEDGSIAFPVWPQVAVDAKEEWDLFASGQNPPDRASVLAGLAVAGGGLGHLGLRGSARAVSGKAPAHVEASRPLTSSPVEAGSVFSNPKEAAPAGMVVTAPPQRLYHGTRADDPFLSFDPDKSRNIGPHFGPLDQADDFAGYGGSLSETWATRPELAGQSGVLSEQAGKLFAERDAIRGSLLGRIGFRERDLANWDRRYSAVTDDLFAARALEHLEGGRVIPVDAAFSRPLEIPNLVELAEGWSPSRLGVILRGKGVPISEADMAILRAADKNPPARRDLMDADKASTNTPENAAANRLLRQRIEEAGFDSVRYRPAEGSGEGWSYIAVKPNTVKSATTGETLFSNPKEAAPAGLLASSSLDRMAADDAVRPRPFPDAPQTYPELEEFVRTNRGGYSSSRADQAWREDPYRYDAYGRGLHDVMNPESMWFTEGPTLQSGGTMVPVVGGNGETYSPELLMALQRAGYVAPGSSGNPLYDLYR